MKKMIVACMFAVLAVTTLSGCTYNEARDGKALPECFRLWPTDQRPNDNPSKGIKMNCIGGGAAGKG